jgi:hypothetical protein
LNRISRNNLVDDWLKVRKTKKATNTETAFKAFISELKSRKCNIKRKMLKIAATNSWTDLNIVGLII